MSRENAAAKGRRYLTEGRLIVERVTPTEVAATCRGDGHIHRLRWRAGLWSCSCDVRTDRCSHLHALRQVIAGHMTDHAAPVDPHGESSGSPNPPDTRLPRLFPVRLVR